MARQINWNNVSAPAIGNGADYARNGMAMFNQAMETAQAGLSKHEERLKENAESEKAANTALVLKMKAEGKPVSDDFMKKLGMYDGEKINQGNIALDELGMKKDLMGIRHSELGLKRQKLVAEIAAAKAKGGEPSFSQKEAIKNKNKLLYEEALKAGNLGSYGKDKDGKSVGDDVKYLKDVGITRHEEDSYGTADRSSFNDYQVAVRAAMAQGHSKKNIKLALAAATEDGGLWGQATWADEMTMDTDKFMHSLKMSSTK